MFSTRRFVLAVLVVLVLAFALMGLRSCGDNSEIPSGGESVPTGTPYTAPPTGEPTAEELDTDYIEQAIAERLTAVAKKKVSVTCPDAVASKIGTSFSCAVYVDGAQKQAATATVKIDGDDGHFTWKSTPKKN